MFAPTPKSSVSSKRPKPYSRGQKAMSRSSSILGTIKNIVSAPLSWFASNEENFEDLGKRRRLAARDLADSEEGQVQHKNKRMRVDGPHRPPDWVKPPTSGYLDPPPFTSQGTDQRAHRRKEGMDTHARHSSAFEIAPSSGSRLMSVDPPQRYATFNRDPATVPLPLDSPVRSTPRRSVDPEDALRQPHTPFRLRTSLTPQPSPAKPLRRESSAPPPFSSLQSRPMFVKPPAEENQNGELGSQKMLPLGTLAEFTRGCRAPSQDRVLSGLGSASGVPSQISSSTSSDAILQPTKRRSEKVFRELEIYKTPIVPSRYKDANAIPGFLRPKRAHVPIPMTKKGRQSRPSLGMPAKEDRDKIGSTARHDGKPYARKGGIGKLIARRQAEQEEQEHSSNVALASVEEEDEMDTDIEPSSHKRDVGVSTQMTSGSEDERSRSRKAAAKVVDAGAAPSSASRDPFLRLPANVPGGRHQPYGRVGRTRTRDPGQRSVPLGRPTNRFSAIFDDDEGTDGASQSTKMNETVPSEKARTATEVTKAPGYEAPKGFSFASDASSVNHDRAGAKEPPISSLPFSLSNTAVPHVDAAAKTEEITSLKLPASVFPMAQPSLKQADKKEECVPSAPKLSVVPPTPDQFVKEAKETSAVPKFFAMPSGTSGPGSAPEPNSAFKPTGIPNFFANSALLAGNKPTTPAPEAPTPSPFSLTPAASLATPVKDPENPLWNGVDAVPSAPPKLFAGASKPFTFGPKPGDAASASNPSVAPAPLFGQPASIPAPADNQQADIAPVGVSAPSRASASSVGETSSGTESTQAPAKPADSGSKPAGSEPLPFFSFGTGASSNAPKPLFGTGGTTATSSSFSAQPSKRSLNASTDVAQGQTFSFGAPQATSAANKSSDAQSAQPSQYAAPSTEQKSTFMFGAPSTTSATSATVGNDNVAAPKPLFGGATEGSGFTCGTSAASAIPNADPAKPTSPFAFGAPPATPPAGERSGSPFTFGATIPSSGGSTGFTFGTPAKPNGTEAGTVPSTPTGASPFTFGAQPARPVTPPSRPDEGMNMEESPTHMDVNGTVQKRPAGSMSFGSGPTPVNPFGQNTSSATPFGFGASPSTSTTPNLFAPKNESKPATSDANGGFNFNRTSSAPAISTSFSFGVKSDQSTPPATAFGAPSNPFGQPLASSTTSSPFSFGQQQQPAPVANPFGAPAQSAQTGAAGGSTPSSPFTNTPAFTFGVPAAAPSNPFTFGSSAPSSPANSSTGLPQMPVGGPAFTFGQPSGASGSTLFNIGAPPSTNPSNTPGRQMKKLPRRGPPPKR